MKKDKQPVPARHIGIIMDGNGRWAKKRGLPRSSGHDKGAEVFGNIVRYCRDIGVEYLTVYAFSTENWRRPPGEVEKLMSLLRRSLKEIEKYRDENIRLLFLGDPTPLDQELKDLMRQVEEGSRENTGITVCVALNYGGRDEICHAVRCLAEQVQQGGLRPEEIDEACIERALYTAGIPDPDLILRPSGEKRISNFLLWQSAYAEYIFMDILWPDFTPKDLDRALEEFSARNRRFGGVDG